VTAVRTAPIGDVLDWSTDELRRVHTLLGLRRYWMRSLYPQLRRDYDRRVGGLDSPPASLHEARPVAAELPGLAYFNWLDRYVQHRLWEEVGRMADRRLEEHPHLLEPDDSDLGTLVVDDGFDQPDYYADYDFHRQSGGIWRDDRGALVYALGARVIHVNSRDPFALHEHLARGIPADSPARVLDLGCGFGKTTIFLKQRWPDAQVVGVDLSAPVLRLGRKLASERGLSIDWVQADAENLPEADRSFDVVTLSMMLHELPMNAIVGTLAEARRVLRPGGVFVALETRLTGHPLRDLLGAYHSEITGEPYINAFRDRDFASLARQAGFRDATAEPWYVPGATPESELRPDTWATAWARLTAVRED
jgi:SAM-dependent methyltransferase